MITNTTSGTNLHEIAPGIFRINTPVEIPGASGFSFNQYLVPDEAPLLFHTRPRRLFPLVSEAIGKVVPLERLRYVAFSHYEADECGALNDFLAAVPVMLVSMPLAAPHGWSSFDETRPLYLAGRVRSVKRLASMPRVSSLARRCRPAS